MCEANVKTKGISIKIHNHISIICRDLFYTPLLVSRKQNILEGLALENVTSTISKT